MLQENAKSEVNKLFDISQLLKELTSSSEGEPDCLEDFIQLTLQALHIELRDPTSKKINVTNLQLCDA